MPFPAVVYTTNRGAASGMVNNAQEAGLSVNALNEIAQIQSVVANLLKNDPSTASVPAADVSSGTFGANIPDTRTYNFPSALGWATLLSSTTALATPSALVATTSAAFASTVSGATLMGFGTTNDVTLVNQAGTPVLGIVANSTAVTMAGNLTASGTAITFGAAGAAYSISGTTTALTTDLASGATTLNANIGTGAGAIGGFILRLPLKLATSATAQSLTTALTITATTTAASSIISTFTGAVAATTFQASSNFQTSGGSVIFTNVNGNVTLTDTAQTSFGRLNLGPIGSGFPAIKVTATLAAFTLADGTSAAPVTAASFLAVLPTSAGIGYGTGAGGTVAQATDRTTAVTLNTLTGTITTQATSLAALASVTFTFTNSNIAISDTVVITQRSGSTANTSIAFVSATAAGSCTITLYNRAVATADTGAMIINFVVVKGVTS